MDEVSFLQEKEWLRTMLVGESEMPASLAIDRRSSAELTIPVAVNGQTY